MTDNEDENVEECDEEDEYDPIGKYLGERNTIRERHGKGWAILPNGDQYDGEYRHGKRHGFGLYVFKNGARYLGNYRCGKKSGEGKFYYPDGGFYEGNWKRDFKHGCGTYIYPNGDEYRGKWHKGYRHGLGVYHYNHAEICFKATWKRGIPVGPAELHFPRHKFFGNWDFQYPQGPGIYTFDCKYMLNGYYKSDIPKFPSSESLGEREYEEEDFLEMEEFNEDEVNCKPKIIVPPSIWYAQNMLEYDYSKLPQQPVPLPISDSEESICDISPAASICEMPCEFVCEMEEGEEDEGKSLGHEAKGEDSDVCSSDDNRKLN